MSCVPGKAVNVAWSLDIVASQSIGCSVPLEVTSPNVAKPSPSSLHCTSMAVILAVVVAHVPLLMSPASTAPSILTICWPA
ncbi:MAG: hypothetical protein EBY29_00915 [Planctomycetes bacterium]|nr:hypothetical protein [Planctomycetota bacterium]